MAMIALVVLAIAGVNRIIKGPSHASHLTAQVGAPLELTGAGGSFVDVEVARVVDPAQVGSGGVAPGPGQRLVAAQVEILNRSAFVYSPDPVVQVEALDAAGHAYPVDAGVTVTAGSALDSSMVVSTQQSASGFVVFLVPDGVQVARVEYAIDGVGTTGETGTWTVGPAGP